MMVSKFAPAGSSACSNTRTFARALFIIQSMHGDIVPIAQICQEANRLTTPIELSMIIYHYIHGKPTSHPQLGLS